MSLISTCVVICSLLLGRYRINWSDFLNFITNNSNQDPLIYNILIHIRIPRALFAYLIGIALSVSGAVYQSLFQNRLVSPGVLGVNSGACVGAGISILLGTSIALRTIISFSFGILAVLLSFLIQRMSKNKTPVVLVLAGIVTCGLMDSIMGIIKYIADGKNQLASITFWMLGSLADTEMQQVLLILPFVIVCTGILLLLSWHLNAMSIGEKTAISLGINYRAERIIIVGCATLLTSITISFSGSIGWVGLIIPNIVQSIFGSDNKRSLPMVIFFGGIFMVIVDTLARSLSPSEIPLGIITGFFGALVYCFILMKKRNIAI